MRFAICGEVITGVVVECVGREDLGGRGPQSMGFLDARVVGRDERGFGDECVLFG